MSLQFLKNSLKAIGDLLHSEVWLLKGTEINSKQICTLLYSGKEVHKNYIISLLFEDQHTETALGKISAYHLRRLISHHKNKYDLVCVEGLKLQQWLYQKPCDFFIPMWLQSGVDIPLQARSRSIKDELRRLKKYKLSYRIATTEVEFKHFYHQMYLPTMAKRHAERTIAMDYEAMMQELKINNGQLLLVIMEDLPIAGSIIRMKTKTPNLWSTGILNGDTDYRKTGVTSATYVFCANHLAEHGFKEMDMGLSRAFLSDGVLLYKKKWNSRFSIKGQRGFILKIMNFNKATRSFLKVHPFVHQKNKFLITAVFSEQKQPSPETISKLKSKYHLTGVDQFRHYPLN